MVQNIYCLRSLVEMGTNHRFDVVCFLAKQLICGLVPPFPVDAQLAAAPDPAPSRHFLQVDAKLQIGQETNHAEPAVCAHL